MARLLRKQEALEGGWLGFPLTAQQSAAGRLGVGETVEVINSRLELLREPTVAGTAPRAFRLDGASHRDDQWYGSLVIGEQADVLTYVLACPSNLWPDAALISFIWAARPLAAEPVGRRRTRQLRVMAALADELAPLGIALPSASR